MKRADRLIVGLFFAASRAGPVCAQSSDSVLAITNVTVIDVAAGVARPRTTVVVRGNRITLVGPSATVRAPAGARSIDGAGRFLIPGLWDMHVHLGNAGEESLGEFVKHGVTGVRDMGTEQYEPLRRWRVEIPTRRRRGARSIRWRR